MAGLYSAMNWMCGQANSQLIVALGWGPRWGLKPARSEFASRVHDPGFQNCVSCCACIGIGHQILWHIYMSVCQGPIRGKTQCIKMRLPSKNMEVVLSLYIVLLRPLLNYFVQFWISDFKKNVEILGRDQMKDTKTAHWLESSFTMWSLKSSIYLAYWK